jgi:RNA polymerase sigma-70 factor (ECF subfamily)
MKNPKNSYSDGTSRYAERQTDRACQNICDGGSEDDVLIKRCRTGNMAAFEQLVLKYQDRLFNAVFRMVGDYDDAMELTQEAFYRAMKGLKKFRGNAGFYTWLFRIGMNLCINHHRRQQRIQIRSLSGDDQLGHQADALTVMAKANDSSPVYQAQVRENHGRVLAALEELEASARAVVVLRDIEELDYAQIADILQVPTGTVKSRLSRARAALRRQLLKGQS